MYILYRNAGQFAAQNKNFHLKPRPHGGVALNLAHNQGKIKHGVLGRIVYEVVSGYICNMEIY
jgi:hypothetical protein